MADSPRPTRVLEETESHILSSSHLDNCRCNLSLPDVGIGITYDAVSRIRSTIEVDAETAGTRPIGIPPCESSNLKYTA